MARPDVSICLIAMVHTDHVRRCLRSIFEHTRGVSYEVIVVAHQVPDEALTVIRSEFQGVRIIKSSGIRGFAENMNQALRIAEGRAALVLNDDTFVVDDSVSRLCVLLDQRPDVDLVSPVIRNFDGTVQLAGRPKLTVGNWLLTAAKLDRWFYAVETLPEGGPQETYEVSGAAFLGRLDVLQELGFFDEYYFFTPEDIALSTLARLRSKKIVLTADATVYHLGSGTARPLDAALLPVANQGLYRYFRVFSGRFVEWSVRLMSAALLLLKSIYWLLKISDERTSIMRAATLNGLRYVFRDVPPKDLFILLKDSIGPSVARAPKSEAVG